MAKSSRQRVMPRTPQDRPPAPPQSAPPAAPAAVPNGRPSSASAPPRPTTRTRPVEPEYLITGTGCTAGHVRGQELDAGRLGTVPSRKRARIGFGLVVWCVAGLAFLAAAGITTWTWSTVGAQVAMLWLAFAAFAVRTSGHRRRCWRTRTWRHAWGGLAPGSG
jgi:hypothetical protein